MIIMLVGAGNLGERYLEGLIKLKAKKKFIYVYDKNKVTLKKIKHKYHDFNTYIFPINQLKEVKKKDLTYVLWPLLLPADIKL